MSYDKRYLKYRKKTPYRLKQDEKLEKLLPPNHESFPYYGQGPHHDKGFIGLSKVPHDKTHEYEFVGMGCDTYGNRGYLFKKKEGLV